MRAMTLRAALLPLLLLQTAAPASAAPKAPAKAARTAPSLHEITRMLSSSDVDGVRSGLESAAQLPPRQVLPVVEERIRAGLPPVLLDVAIDTLLLLDDPSAAPLFVSLSQHRRPAVRKRAVEALARVRNANTERLLTRALGDQDADVRSAAATGLGELGAKNSFDALWRAQERGVTAAAGALGKVANADQLSRLLELIGSAPLDIVAPLAEALFARRDLAESDKLKVSQKLSDLGTQEARALRDELLAKLPAEASPRLRRALADEASKGAN